jgi:hypothetical protein
LKNSFLEGKEILRSGKERKVPFRTLQDSSLDSVLKDRDCVEPPVQKLVLAKLALRIFADQKAGMPARPKPIFESRSV